MSIVLRTNLGNTEAVIADDGTLRLFYQVAAIIHQDLKLKVTHKEDEFDSINWYFRYRGHSLTLHYNIYNGVMIVPTNRIDKNDKDNKMVVEMAGLLQGRLGAEIERRRIA